MTSKAIPHGGYGKRREKPAARRPKDLAVARKPKSVSLKNRIRSIERISRKNLPPEMREVQEKKLEGLKKQQEVHCRLAVERKIFFRDRKIKFFERRKIERRLERLQKLQRASSTQKQDSEISEQLSKLKEDREYVRFFPKTEKYVSLFNRCDESDIVDQRNRLRKQIKANLIAAAASGNDLEETGSEDDGLQDLSDDDFFLSGSSSVEADGDDKSTREQASSAFGKAAFGISSGERNRVSASLLMPRPRPTNSRSSSVVAESIAGASSGRNSILQRAKLSSSTKTSNFRRGSYSNGRNESLNSDAHKPRRKRRRKKKNQKV